LGSAPRAQLDRAADHHESSELWFDQRSDLLVPPDRELQRRAAEAANRIMASPAGRHWISRI
jgi:hypothetical protein